MGMGGGSQSGELETPVDDCDSTEGTPPNSVAYWVLWTLVVAPGFVWLGLLWVVLPRRRDRLRKLIWGPEYGDALPH
jgi:hypothetical protein